MQRSQSSLFSTSSTLRSLFTVPASSHSTNTPPMLPFFFYLNHYTSSSEEGLCSHQELTPHLTKHEAHLHEGSLTVQTISKQAGCVSNRLFTNVKRKCKPCNNSWDRLGPRQTSQKKNLPSRYLLKLRHYPSAPTSPSCQQGKSQFFLHCLVLVTPTKVSLALQMQSCPAAEDNSQ